MGLTMFNDAKAAISMGKMDGLLRRRASCEMLSFFSFFFPALPGEYETLPVNWNFDEKES